MNRRDFLKAAVAGLVALVLPEGKAEAPPPSMHVRFTEDETAWRYTSSGWVDVPGPYQMLAWGPSPEIITLPPGTKLSLCKDNDDSSDRTASHIDWVIHSTVTVPMT